MAKLDHRKSDVIADIRQKVVEEPWFGRAVTDAPRTFDIWATPGASEPAAQDPAPEKKAEPETPAPAVPEPEPEPDYEPEP